MTLMATGWAMAAAIMTGTWRHIRILTYSIGIGHSCQLVEKLPVEKTDCKPYQVILV